MAPAKKNATAAKDKSKDGTKSKDTSAAKMKTKTKETPEDTGASSSSKSKLKPATAINVRHILCEKHSKKEEALQKLRDGTKFDEVAREFSEDKARQGGSLGWKTRGSLMGDFEEVAYKLDVSSCNKPVWGEVKTKEGYHVMIVEGRR
jgi:NIMA-interacting peptidyl-prolyl cis-trans isomerase 4